MTEVSESDLLLVEKNRPKLRRDDFAEVELDADDIEIMRRHAPDLAAFGYQEGDSTDARLIKGVYQTVIETHEQAQRKEAEARWEQIESEAREERKRQAVPTFKPLTPHSVKWWAEATDDLVKGLPSLTRQQIADVFAANDAEFIDLDTDCKGNTRRTLRHLWARYRMNLLLAREERMKLEARVEALEASALSLADAYQGSHMSGKSYERGQVVNHDGSMWLALSGTDRKPGTTDSGWRLIVKAGRDAK